MSRRIVPIAVVILVLAVLPATAADTASRPAVPTWPQPFALINGEQTSFLIAVTNPGAIVAIVTWKGVPLTLTLTDGRGQVVTTVPGRAAPTGALEYKVTRDDLSRGPLWAVTLATAKGPRRLAADGRSLLTAASGSVTVTCPPIDEAILDRALATVRQQRAADEATMAAQYAAKTTSITTTASILPSPQRQAELAAQEQIVRAKFASLTAAASNSALPGITKANPVSTRELVPTIQSITPSNGSTGDVVTVTATCISDPGRTDVTFNFGGTSAVGVPAVPATTNSQTAETTFSVKVPATIQTFSGTTKISVTLVDRSRNPYYVSKPCDFSYDPFPAPIITSINPAIVVPTQSVLVNGARFQSGDVAHFIIPGVGDLASTSTTVSSNSLLRAVVPSFYTSDALTAQLYVIGRGAKRSGPISFVVNPNQSAVTSVYPTEAKPWECVVLSGKLLGNVNTVTYTVRSRNQQAPGTAYIANSLYSTSQPRTLSIVSKSDVSLLVRIPSLGGFSGPLLIDMSFTGAGQPVTVPFTINPDYVDSYYRIKCTRASFTQHEGHDEWKNTPLAQTAWLMGCHWAGDFLGHRADDVYWTMPWVLNQQYNWSFGSATLDLLTCGPAGASINSSGVTPISIFGVPAGAMWVSVHSWADIMVVGFGGGIVSYYVTMTLHGPSGVPALRSTVDNQLSMPNGTLVSQ